MEKRNSIAPYYFENVILIVSKKMGNGEFIETSKSKGADIDGIINEDSLGLDKIYIQAKWFTEKNVKKTDSRNSIAAMNGDANLF